jgi:uncharacterized membrane protein YeiB
LTHRDIKAAFFGLLASGFGPLVAVSILALLEPLSFADFTTAFIIALLLGFPFAFVFTALFGLPLLFIARRFGVMNATPPVM